MKKRYLWLMRRAYRTLRHPQMRGRAWWRKLTRPLFEKRLWKPCRDTVAAGMSIGMFFSMMPIPMQSFFAAVVALRARANIPFSIGACFVSNPLTNVPIWLGQLAIGNFIQHHIQLPIPEILAHMEKTLPGVGQINAGNFIVGAVVSGILLAFLSFPLVHLFAVIMPHHLPVLHGRGKTSPNPRHQRAGAVQVPAPSNRR